MSARTPSSAKEALLPCPFCGNNSLKLLVDEEEWDIARVSCQVSGCYALGPYVDFCFHDDNPEAAAREAVRLWNLRALRAQSEAGQP